MRDSLAGGEGGLDRGNVDPLRRSVRVVGAEERDVSYTDGLGEIQEAGDSVDVRNAQHGSHEIEPVHADQGVRVGGRIVPVEAGVGAAPRRGTGGDPAKGEGPSQPRPGPAGASQDQYNRCSVAHCSMIGAWAELINACSAPIFV